VRSGNDRDYWWYVTNDEGWWERAGAAQPFVQVSKTLSRPWVIPPLPEQAAIVRVLDHADRRIRRYIRAKQKLIKLLEEQKQAIIHRAVTRGLDPDVRLKPSGVEWLGEVPEHWEVKRLRQFVDLRGGMTPSMERRDFWGGEIPWVTPKDMKRAAVGQSLVRVSEEALTGTSLSLLPPGVVLIVVRGMILARRVPIAWTTAAVTINQDMKALVPRSGVCAEYLVLTLMAAEEAIMLLIDEAGHGTRRLPTQRLRDLLLATPSEAEQQEIVRFVKSAISNRDSTIEAAQREITLLHEYRTRLIADVVTGKLDVREAAARLPDEADPTDLLNDTDESAEDPDAIDDADLSHDLEEIEA
jgi:type I restriction enzyme S subunit